ncbi:MAG: hypothetical protein L6422_00590 [Candidatus Marinimicrobia bacterium]|nr:hypothetical protein [bacterium]MCG2714777.1 hypothetical protein [Candidatus Neomarinimicrobiota bacterium]
MKRVYELDVYADPKDPLRGRHAFSTNRQKRYQIWSGTTEETKLWLRKLIRRKVLSESNAAEYKAIVEKLGPKLNAFINSTKASRPNFQFPISNYNVP